MLHILQFHIIKSNDGLGFISGAAYCASVVPENVSMGVCVEMAPLGDILNEISGLLSFLVVDKLSLVDGGRLMSTVVIVAAAALPTIGIRFPPSFAENDRCGLLTLLTGNCRS